MNKYLTEFIGTFFLVLTVGCTVLGGVQLAALAIGASLMVMIYAGGHVSGGHYNPAVTLAVWLRGRCPMEDLLPYWVAQVLGAVVAAFAVQALGFTAPDKINVFAHKFPAFLAEFLFTFALGYVVLNAATTRGNSGNSFYGVAIGMTVMTGALAVGSISGAAFNPAVAVGVTVMKISAVSNLWIYFVAQLLGGAAAAGVFKVINPNDK
jgi:aquaporin Z